MERHLWQEVAPLIPRSEPGMRALDTPAKYKCFSTSMKVFFWCGTYTHNFGEKIDFTGTIPDNPDMLFSTHWHQKYKCFGTGTKSTLLRWHLYAQFWWEKDFTGTIPDKPDMLFSIHWYQNWLLRSWRTCTAWANQIPPHHYLYVIIFLALNLSMLSHQLVSGVSESETFHARFSLHLLTAGPAQCERSARSVSVSWCIPLCTRPHLRG